MYASIRSYDLTISCFMAVEVERCARVLDGIVTVLDASAGVQAQTLTVWRQAAKFHLPSVFFVNKMDKKEADFQNSVDSVEQKLGIKALITSSPVYENDQLCGIVDAVSKKFVPLETDGLWQNVETNTHMGDILRASRENLCCDLSDLDAPFMSLFLEGSGGDPMKVSQAEIIKALRRITLSNRGTAIGCGSALRCPASAQPVLDHVVNFLPSPKERNTSITQLFDKEFCGFVFKIGHDKRKGKLSFVRVYAGTLSSNSILFNSNRGTTDGPIKDPSLRVRYDSETGQTVVETMGELHMDIIKNRLVRDYGLNVFVGPLQVRLELPSAVPTVRADWLKAINEGCVNALHNGPILGFPVQDVVITLKSITTSGGRVNPAVCKGSNFDMRPYAAFGNGWFSYHVKNSLVGTGRMLDELAFLIKGHDGITDRQAKFNWLCRMFEVCKERPIRFRGEKVSPEFLHANLIIRLSHLNMEELTEHVDGVLEPIEASDICPLDCRGIISQQYAELLASDVLRLAELESVNEGPCRIPFFDRRALISAICDLFSGISSDLFQEENGVFFLAKHFKLEMWSMALANAVMAYLVELANRIGSLQHSIAQGKDDRPDGDKLCGVITTAVEEVKHLLRIRVFEILNDVDREQYFFDDVISVIEAHAEFLGVCQRILQSKSIEIMPLVYTIRCIRDSTLCAFAQNSYDIVLKGLIRLAAIVSLPSSPDLNPRLCREVVKQGVLVRLLRTDIATVSGEFVDLLKLYNIKDSQVKSLET
ncbi:elongation factor Tu GTP binding domain protein [Teladorsagia circumcincta]|uniref:Elongation factor Tu GTP binding domain protein n=1 Tax=Teladorsagia circumcincta TaxID=45464 RepID=A0A2G9UZK3_TELCI|nr:elongation factor Tu GTP binding domain protein [Teladorsagia circumcincta]